MNEHAWTENEALVDLLAKRATEGLDTHEAQELARLLTAYGASAAEIERGFESVVARLDVAFAEAELAETGEGVPAHVMAGLRELGEQYRAGVAGSTAGAARAGASAAGSDTGGLRFRRAEEASARPGWVVWGGWLAAAACFALAVVAWWPGGMVNGRPPIVLTLEQRVENLKARPGVVTVSWLGLDDAGLAAEPNANDQDLRGEVVWDNASNEGFMVFEGLAANDPSAMQYQLWIFDTERRLGDLPQFAVDGLPILTQRPVDGGVFDMKAAAEGGRVIVPIHAKLPVGRAALFAVTAEPPGGVVVSDRDIVTLALVPTPQG